MKHGRVMNSSLICLPPPTKTPVSRQESRGGRVRVRVGVVPADPGDFGQSGLGKQAGDLAGVLPKDVQNVRGGGGDGDKGGEQTDWHRERGGGGGTGKGTGTGAGAGRGRGRGGEGEGERERGEICCRGDKQHHQRLSLVFCASTTSERPLPPWYLFN